MFEIMTIYEWARVLINLGQLIAMIVIPIIVVKYKVKLTYTDDHDDKKDKK